MGYTNCINITDALYFDLFDDISYKWLKQVLDPKMDKDEYDFEVEIEDQPCDHDGYYIVKFTFDLKMLHDERFGENYYHTKSFSKIIKYRNGSPFGIKLYDMFEEDEEEEIDEEEIYDMSFNIAINKIKRSKIYNFGLGLKLNMRDAMNVLNNLIIDEIKDYEEYKPEPRPESKPKPQPVPKFQPIFTARQLYDKKRYAEKCEEKKEYQRLYYQANPEKFKEYYQKNKKDRVEYQRRYRASKKV